jgi:hypothetical protein
VGLPAQDYWLVPLATEVEGSESVLGFMTDFPSGANVLRTCRLVLGRSRDR